MNGPLQIHPDELRYRDAAVEDAPLLASMNHALIRDERHRNRMSLAELEQRMRDWLAAEYRAILFEHASAAVGYALFRHEPDHVYVRHFYVKPEHRRQGIGRAAVEWLRANPWHAAPRIRLDVLVNNPTGLAFWRNVGFVDYCVTMERGAAADDHAGSS